jgi:hypothetical protein
MIKFNQNNLEELKQDLIDQDMIIFEDEDENKQTFRNTTTTSNQDML